MAALDAVFRNSREIKKGILQLQLSNKDGTSEPDEVEIKDSCFIKDKPFQTYSTGIWSFRFKNIEPEKLEESNCCACLGILIPLLILKPCYV